MIERGVATLLIDTIHIRSLSKTFQSALCDAGVTK